MDGKDKGLRLTVITPNEEFYDGMVESVVVRTLDGYMGFLENRAPACVLLHDEGSLRFRRTEDGGGSGMARAFLNGGFAFMDKELTIYTDQARWMEEDEGMRRTADPAAEDLPLTSH